MPRGRLFALVTVLAVTAITAIAARPFIWPTDAEPFADGPIVVLGGGGGERLTTAMAIRGEGSERTLVVSAGAIDEWLSAGGRCSPAGIVCILPEPVNTYGEARTVAGLVAEHGWDQVTVVTSDFHVTRTRWLFDRCLEVPVRVVAAPTDPHLAERLYRISREMAAMGVAVVRRSCA